jgi:hypothetical protein
LEIAGAAPPWVLPERTADPAAAAALLRRDGACLLAWTEGVQGVQGVQAGIGAQIGAGTGDRTAVGTGIEKPMVAEAGRAVLGPLLLAEWEPRTLRANPKPGKPKHNVRAERLILEPTLLDEAGLVAKEQAPIAEGWGLGDGRPEYLVFLCAQEPIAGGHSYLVRSDRLAAAGDGADALPGGGSLVHQTISGRWVVSYEAPAAPAECDQGLVAERAAVVERWHAAVAEAAASAPRFPIALGEVLVVDNYRVFQGRDPYRGDRVIYRTWLWSAEALSFPMLGDQAAAVEE